MTHKEYLDIDAVNASRIIDFIRSERHYWAKWLNPDKPKEPRRTSLEMGTAVHSAILEGKEDWHVKPDLDMRYNKNKDIVREWEASLPEDPFILSADEAHKVRSMIDNLRQHDLDHFMWLTRKKDDAAIEKCYKEHVLHWQSSYGFACKAKLDMLMIVKDKTVRPILVDVKTTRDGSYAGMRGSVKTYRYDIQMAFYAYAAMENGLVDEFPSCWLACVENVYPFAPVYYGFHESDLLSAQVEIREALHNMRLAHEHNASFIASDWASYPSCKLDL